VWFIALVTAGKGLRVASEAHRHALETLQDRSRWWVTPLPEDLAEPPVDIRTVDAPPPFTDWRSGPAGELLAPGLDKCVEWG
jgi:hypothetical protein